MPQTHDPILSPARPGEAGSVIIYIFIAVAMFVTLTFVVSHMMRGSEGGMKKELVTVASGEILQYGNTLRSAVQAMRVDGVNVTGISFNNSFESGYENPACPDTACEIFNSNGGGVKYEKPQADWLDWHMESQPLYGAWYFPPDVCVANVGKGDTTCDSDGEDNEELVAILPYIKRDICLDLNRRLNIENPGGDPPRDSGCAWSNPPKTYKGAFSESESIESSSDSEILGGRQSGCFEIGTCGSVEAHSYHFYQVLMAR
jgi:hypothetical protein